MDEREKSPAGEGVASTEEVDRPELFETAAARAMLSGGESDGRLSYECQ